MDLQETRILRLQRGDILVIERSFAIPNWQEALRNAAKVAGIDFEVPVVFVDDLDEISVVRRG